MAQDTLQDEVHLHGAGVCLNFWNFQRGIYDSFCKGNRNHLFEFSENDFR